MTTAPAGASPAAVAYMAAIEASTPSWLAIHNKLQAQVDILRGDDLVAEYQADSDFVLALEAIDFPPDVTPAASDLIYSILDYLTFLNETINKRAIDEAYGPRDEALLAARGTAAAHLREVLQLPPGNCGYRRP